MKFQCLHLLFRYLLLKNCVGLNLLSSMIEWTHSNLEHQLKTGYEIISFSQSSSFH